MNKNIKNNIKFLISGGYADIYIDKTNNIVYKTFYNPCRNEIIYSWLKEIIFLSELSHKNIMKLLDIKFNNPLINNFITQKHLIEINTSQELYTQYYKLKLFNCLAVLCGMYFKLFSCYIYKI